VVSQKKIKKQKRELQRKAKKISEPKAVTEPPTNTHIDSESGNQEVPSSILPPAVQPIVKPDSPNELDSTPNIVTIPTPTKKHSHWLTFTRHFLVDQLSTPSSWCITACWSTECNTALKACIYQRTNTPDCPIHLHCKPHPPPPLHFPANTSPDCPCHDPILLPSYLVFPSTPPLTLGPFNSLRARTLLAHYQSDPRTANRVMLLDAELWAFVTRAPGAKVAMPARLSEEYFAWAAGHAPGPAMRQAEAYQALCIENEKEAMSREALVDVQKGCVEEGEGVCYCCVAAEEVRDGEAWVECEGKECATRWFHAKCLEGLGTEKVSRWLCSSCETGLYRVAEEVTGMKGGVGMVEEGA
jgi:hypothetical protein